MRTSLYDAIGVSNSSSTSEIRAALRALVRRFWAVPRDPSGDSEEALRFVSLAAGILTDDRRRDNYDVSLSPGVGAGPWRVPSASARQSAVDHPTDLPSAAAIDVGVSQLSVDVARDVTLPSVEAFAENFPGETSRPIVGITAAALAAVVLVGIAALALAREWGAGPLVGLALGGAAVVLAALIGATTAQRACQSDGAQSLSHLAVIKWRRDGSVFVGVPPPQQDTAWLFRLRMAELTRSTNGYLVQPVPWRRVLARAFDLALSIWVVALLANLLSWLLPGTTGQAIATWSLSPILLPTLAVLLLLAIEPALMARFGWTPGKWLLGLYAVSGVTHVGARPRHEVRVAARRRAWQAAWHGLAMGFLPATLLLLKRHWHALRDNEPRWDAASDTVILARPVAWLPATSAALTVLAALLLATTFWTRNITAVWNELSTWLAALRPPASISAPRARPTPPVEAAVDAAPTGAAQAPRAESAPPSSPGRTPATKAPPPNAPPVDTAEMKIAQQAAGAQSRRARIERAEAAVAAVRRGQGTYGPLQSLCQRWTEDQPGSAEAWRCYGLAQYENGAGTAALPALRTALRLEPKDPEAERAILMILRPQ
jgi:hypothetical protein